MSISIGASALNALLFKRGMTVYHSLRVCGHREAGCTFWGLTAKQTSETLPSLHVLSDVRAKKVRMPKARKVAMHLMILPT